MRKVLSYLANGAQVYDGSMSQPYEYGHTWERRALLGRARTYPLGEGCDTSPQSNGDIWPVRCLRGGQIGLFTGRSAINEGDCVRAAK